MHARPVKRNSNDQDMAKELGIWDPERKLSLNEMAEGNITYAVTGITRGPMLNGVRLMPGRAETHFTVVHSHTGTVYL